MIVYIARQARRILIFVTLLVSVMIGSVSFADLNSMSTSLGTPVNIYEYLLNNTEYTLYHGCHSQPEYTLQAKIGNDVDLASTLIAMLGHQNITARYVVGTIRVPSEQVMNWLGVKNVNLAVSAMKYGEFSMLSSVRMEHMLILSMYG